MRRLELHSSALSDDEYALYTNAINDITLSNDVQYDNLKIGIREIRAWLRGRYSHVPSATIDTILRYFSSDFAQDDILSAGEFFAALRLVIHAQSGREIDRALAFVQANPKQATPAPTNLPPPNPFTHMTSRNPFVSSPKQVKAVPTRLQDASPKLPPLPPRKPTAPHPQPPAPPRHTVTSSPSLVTPQPLFKRSPNPYLTPTISPAPNLSATIGPPPPPPSHLKPANHVTSVLMKQSLTASKIAQSLKKAEEQLEKERHLHVIKSTSGGHISNKSPHHSPSPPRSRPIHKSPVPMSSASASSGSDQYSHSQPPPPPLPKRRPQLLPPRMHSPPISTSSFEQVALATAPLPSRQYPPPPPPPPQTQDGTMSRSRLNSGNNSPQKEHHGLLPTAPPTHPDRKPPPLPLSDHPRSPFDSVYNISVSPPASASASSPALSSPSIDSPSRQHTLRHTHSSSHSHSSSPTATPTTRVFRSKSLNVHVPPPIHNSSINNFPPPPQAPPPPARRKRPESIQVLGSPSSGGVAAVAEAFDNVARGAMTPSRQSSMASPNLPNLSIHRKEGSGGSVASQTHSYDPHFSTSSSTQSNSNLPLNMSQIQKALAGLQPKIDARLDKARYKAEAGLSRRGFMRGPGGGHADEEGLMKQDKWSGKRAGTVGRHGFGHGYPHSYSADEGRYRDDVTTVDDNGEDGTSAFGVNLDGDDNEATIRGRTGRSRMMIGGNDGVGDGSARQGWNPKVGDGWQPL